MNELRFASVRFVQHGGNHWTVDGDLTLHGLRTVESHPVALAQCGAFLRGHPRLRARAVPATPGQGA